MSEAHAFSYPVLLGDVGGTNARFALLDGPGATPRLLPGLLTGAFSDPIAAIRSALVGQRVRPRSALLAVAARVEGPTVSLVNAGWTFEADRIAAVLDLDRAVLVNDFVPLAAATTAFSGGDLDRLGPEMPGDSGPRLVIGAGTGFGASALLPVGEGALIHATEAGHVEFGPTDAEEERLWPFIEKANGRMTAEVLLSGPGLMRLSDALCRLRSVPQTYAKPNDIIEGFAAGESEAAATVHLFGRLLGRFAGDLALVFGATGGVFVAGGVAPRIVSGLQDFREAFERKWPYEAVLRRTPTWVVRHPHPALFGLAQIVARPERFTYPSS